MVQMTELCNEGATRNDIGTAAFPEFLSYKRLDQIAMSTAASYASAQPYPHVVIDSLFDEWVLERVLAEFPHPRTKNWTVHDIPQEIKLQSKSELDIPPFTRHFLYALNSATFLRFLEKLTGIESLIGDPQFEGGGLHQIVSGGKLAIHADFNKHACFGLDRRLNMLIYLNKQWEEVYGGHFELWDGSMTRMIKKVAPLFNRVVIFTTSESSYHGHPDPLSCPPEVTRKSLALYYYTNGGVRDQQPGGRHSTFFQPRPGEQFRASARHIARDLMPPLLWRVAARALGSSGE
jgi:Rps23 Pro-64 3,4-dihydroxylase Tpa1-like proline 4-hydroxylase